MGTGIGCTVYADGVRLADGQLGEPDGVPTVLSGLSVVWGRDTTVDQPEASTCSFELMDAPGGGSFAELLRTGTAIDVNAAGMVYPDPTEPVWPDPGFETGLPGIVRSNSLTSRSSRRTSSGSYALRIDPVDGSRRSTTVVAPALFSAPGTDPGAWDAIPTTSEGQTWTYGASVWAPPGAVVLVRPVLFSGPYAADAVVFTGSALTVTGGDAGGWQTVSGTFVPGVDGAWVGVQISTYPGGWSWDQLAPELTWDALTSSPYADWQWDDFGSVYLDDVTVLAPAAGVESVVRVFSGRVIALEAAFDNSTGTPVVKVSCADFTADLDNADVGDEPWSVEPMGDRFERILSETGMTVGAEIDASVSGISVSWRDVDSQPAAGLLGELATSVDAVMWSATHIVTGPYLRVEDPTNRPSQHVLELVDGTVQIVDGGALALVLSACDVLRDDVKWEQDTQDVVTRAAVTWKEQGTDDDGKPTTTDRTVTLIDRPLEAEYGLRRLALSTELVNADDAGDVAAKLLARTSVSDWRADGIVIDDGYLDDADADDTERLLTLLDGTSRNGLPVSLVDLPPWTPAGDVVPVYLEGGSYSFTDGVWRLDLTVSNATAQGASVQWDQLDSSWQWDQFDPSISWDDLRGVGA